MYGNADTVPELPGVGFRPSTALKALLAQCSVRDITSTDDNDNDDDDDNTGTDDNTQQPGGGGTTPPSLD